MRNFLLIILISVSTSSFSQVKIDTSEIKSIRYEWNINPKTSDTTLWTKLTEYKSGFYHEKMEFLNDSSKFGHFFIYKGEKIESQKRADIENHVSGMGNGIINIYYDKFKNPDSIVLLKYEPDFKRISTTIEKQYKRNRKLEFITDLDGKNYYKYNLFGKLKRIEHYRDSVLYRIDNFKNGLLISETFPTRKKHRKKFTYEYNKRGQLVKREDDDYHFYRYDYNEFGIRKIEKVYKKKNAVVEYTIFNYDKNGILKRKKEFARNDKLRNEFIYEYE
ncbi:hypothetical protein [Winogradskyella sp. Asnod2-B02-A]|uniref:hypothetical protein n=1 Tax=Winogradskyella sp. Asnod2-B02-A TaxID=3160583 RepID=UPI00386E3412